MMLLYIVGTLVAAVVIKSAIVSALGLPPERAGLGVGEGFIIGAFFAEIFWRKQP